MTFLCLSVCNVGWLWSHGTTKSGSEQMTGQVDDLATCMPKPSRIVVSCDPEFYWRRTVAYWKITASTAAVALSGDSSCYQRMNDPYARMSRYLSIFWVFLLLIFMTFGSATCVFVVVSFCVFFIDGYFSAYCELLRTVNFLKSLVSETNHYVSPPSDVEHFWLATKK